MRKSRLREFSRFDAQINFILGELLFDPTKLSISTGSDAVLDDLFSYQIYNKIKNHWRAATRPADKQLGMICDDSDDDCLYHIITGLAEDEILQVASSHAASPTFTGLTLSGLTASLAVVTNGSKGLASMSYDDFTTALALAQADISGLTTASSPVFVTVKLSGLTDNYFPYHVADGTGLANGVLYTDGTDVLVGGSILAKEAPLVNLLDNSGFQVWSNSDANKGLGSMPYDAGDSIGHTAPVVGETMTGGTSGAVGKIISYTVTSGSWAGGNATGVITLGACNGRFNDNETVTGGTGAAHCVVNTPAGAAGVDLVKGGECEVVTDFTGTLATPSVVAGGQIGNMMTVTNNGAAIGYVYQSVATEVGKIYTLKVYFKKGTATYGNIAIGTSAGGAQHWFSGLNADVNWTAYTKTFEATTTTTYISLYCYQAATNTALFDEVSLYEITSCCTAADALAMDTYTKDATLDIYRQHNDGGTLTKDGAFYAAKLVPSAAADWLDWASGGRSALAEFYQQYAGLPATRGLWVKTSTASHVRLQIIDSAATTSSAYHTGGGAWEWLEVSHTVNAAPTSLNFRVDMQVAGNVDGTTIVYISEDMGVRGSSIGQGNYAPKPNEEILCEQVIPLTNYTATTTAVDATINLEAESAGMIPKGAKAVLVKAYGKDSAAGDGVGFDVQSASGVEDGISVDTQVNNIRVQASGLVKCDSSGDCYYDHRGSGATALTTDIKVVGVQLR